MESAAGSATGSAEAMTSGSCRRVAVVTYGALFLKASVALVAAFGAYSIDESALVVAIAAAKAAAVAAESVEVDFAEEALACSIAIGHVGNLWTSYFNVVGNILAIELNLARARDEEAGVGSAICYAQFVAVTLALVGLVGIGFATSG